MPRRVPWLSLVRQKAGVAWRVIAAGDELECRRTASALELLRDARTHLDALITELEQHAPRETPPALPLLVAPERPLEAA